jgi:O-antigen/teichoic acid export membrane protein
VIRDAAPRSLVGGAVVTAASRVLVAVLGGVTAMVLARVLGPAGWGSYYVAQSLAVMAVTGTSLGVEHGITYFVSSGRWGARSAFASAARLATVAGAAGGGIVILVRVLAPSAFAGLPLWLVVVIAGGLPFALAGLYVSYIALATDHYEASVATPTAQAVILLVLAVPGAVLLGRTGAIVAMTVTTGVIGVGAVVWGRSRLPHTIATEPGALRRAVWFGIRGYAANALQFINYRLDIFILSASVSTVSVGAYSLAVAITSLLWVLPGSLSNVVYPRIARLSHEGSESTRALVETKSLRHASLIVAATSLLLIVGLELLVVPVFGRGYRPAIDLGLILLPGAAAIAVGTVVASIIVGRGKPSYSLYTAAVSTPLTVVLYIVLIPLLHAQGAAVASTASYLFSFAISCHFYRRATGRPLLPLLVPTRAEFADLSRLARERFAGAGRSQDSTFEK